MIVVTLAKKEVTCYAVIHVQHLFILFASKFTTFLFIAIVYDTLTGQLLECKISTGVNTDQQWL